MRVVARTHPSSPSKPATARADCGSSSPRSPTNYPPTPARTPAVRGSALVLDRVCPHDPRRPHQRPKSQLRFLMALGRPPCRRPDGTTFGNCGRLTAATAPTRAPSVARDRPPPLDDPAPCYEPNGLLDRTECADSITSGSPVTALSPRLEPPTSLRSLRRLYSNVRRRSARPGSTSSYSVSCSRPSPVTAIRSASARSADGPSVANLAPIARPRAS